MHETAPHGTPAPGGFSGNPAPGLSCTVRITSAAHFLLAFHTTRANAALHRATGHGSRGRPPRVSAPARDGKDRNRKRGRVASWPRLHPCHSEGAKSLAPAAARCAWPSAAGAGRFAVLGTPAVLSRERQHCAPANGASTVARRRAPRHATERAPLLDPNTQCIIIARPGLVTMGQRRREGSRTFSNSACRECYVSM